MKLYPLPGEGRFYCGPASIAAFTGLHPKEGVRAAINSVRNRAPHQGIVLMFPYEITQVLRHLGYVCSQPDQYGRGATLKEFVLAHLNKSCIVHVTGHFVAVSEGACLDNKSRIARPVEVFPGNRKIIQSVIWVGR